MKILYVDNKLVLREKIINYLGIEDMHGSIFRADDISEAMGILNDNNVDVIVIEEELAGGKLNSLISKINSAGKNPVLIFLTSFKRLYYGKDYEKSGLVYFFDKNIELKKLKLFLNGITISKQK